MGRAAAAGRFLKRLLWEDLHLKLISLVLAAVIFVIIDGELAEQRDVKVARIELPDGWVLAPQAASPEVSVRLRGSRRRSQDLLSVTPVLSLQDALPHPVVGRNVADLRPKFISLGSVTGLEVVGIQPERLEVQLVRLCSRELLVKVRYDGDPPPGYQRDEPIVQPERVTVTAGQDLDRAEFIWTEPIPIRGRSSDFVTVTGLARTVLVGDQEVEVNCPERVTVTVRIRQGVTERFFDNVPVKALAPPGASLHIEPAAVRLAARGAARDLRDLRATDLRVFVSWPADWDVSGAAGQTFPERSVRVEVLEPPRVQVLGDKQGETNGALPLVRITGTLVKP